MKIYSNIKENINLIVLATLIFSIKPLEFLALNISNFNYSKDLIYPIIFHLIIFIFYLIAFFICLNFKKILINKFFIFLAALYYLQYFWLDLSEFLESIIPFIEFSIIYKFIVPISLVSISIFFTNLFFLSKSSDLFLLGALLVCLIQVGTLLININNTLSNSNDNEVAIDNNSEKTYQTSNVIKKNVYYIILDGLTSYDYLLNNMNIRNSDYKSFNNAIENLNFKIFKNSFSSYNSTDLTISSILKMDYFKDNFTYTKRDQVFPLMLNKANPPKLFRSLNNMGYEFVFSGNTGYLCSENFMNVTCANKIVNESESFTKVVLNYLNNEGIKTLIRQSILKRILSKVTKNNSQRWDNDGLEIFSKLSINNIVPNSKKFYFIYNLSPHPPFRDKNCNIDTLSDGGIDWVDINAYSITISCVLDESLNLINRILEIDPGSIIVVQSDHGSNFKYDWMADPRVLKKKELKERFSIFNSIKLPERCYMPNSDSMGQVETINLVLNCISGRHEKIELVNKSFASVAEKNKEFYGRLYDVTENLK